MRSPLHHHPHPGRRPEGRHPASALALVLAAVTLAPVAPPAWAQEIVANRVTDVAVASLPEATEVRIATDSTPSYSIYTLPSPDRIFVDISNSVLEAGPGVITVARGAVAQVAYEQSGPSTSRFVISVFEQPFYDVEATDGALVITIEGTPESANTGGADLSAARNRAAQADGQYAEALRLVASLETELEASARQLETLRADQQEDTRDGDEQEEIAARVG
jgi:hypothetical protein